MFLFVLVVFGPDVLGVAAGGALSFTRVLPGFALGFPHLQS